MLKKIIIFIFILLYWTMLSFGSELSSSSFYITSDVVGGISSYSTNSSGNTLGNNSESCVGTNKSTSYYLLGGFFNTIANESNQLRIVLSISPSQIIANNISQAEVKATIYDKYNNIATYATYPVYFTNFNNTNNKYGYFVGSTTVTPVNGVATIYFHSSSNVSTNIVIQAYHPTSKYLPDSGDIDIVAGAATKLSLSSTKTNFTAGTVTNIIFTVKIYDNYNNLVTTGSYIINFTNTGSGIFNSSHTITVTNGIGTIEFSPSDIAQNDTIIASSTGLESASLTIKGEGKPASRIQLTASSSNIILNSGNIFIKALLTDDAGNLDSTATNSIYFFVKLGTLNISLTNIIKATNGEAVFSYSENKYGGLVTVMAFNNSLGSNSINIYVDINGEVGGNIYNNYDNGKSFFKLEKGIFSGNIRIKFEKVSNLNLAYSAVECSPYNDSIYNITGYEIKNSSIVKNITISDLNSLPVYYMTYKSMNDNIWYYDNIGKGVALSAVTYDGDFIYTSINKFGIYMLGTYNEANKSKIYNLYPNPFNPLKGKINLTFNLSQNDNIRVVVYDVSGNHIRTLIDNKEKDKGLYNVEWDGKDDNGSYVPSGIYILYISGNKLGNYHKHIAVLKLKE